MCQCLFIGVAVCIELCFGEAIILVNADPTCVQRGDLPFEFRDGDPCDTSADELFCDFAKAPAATVTSVSGTSFKESLFVGSAHDKTIDMTGPVQRGSFDGPIADPAAFLRHEADGLCHLDLMAENIHCADCIRKIEGRLKAMPGVAAARVNLSLRRIAIAWREGEVEPVALVEAVTRLGYPAAPFDPGLLDERTKAADRELQRQGVRNPTRWISVHLARG